MAVKVAFAYAKVRVASAAMADNLSVLALVDSGGNNDVWQGVSANNGQWQMGNAPPADPGPNVGSFSADTWYELELKVSFDDGSQLFDSEFRVGGVVVDQQTGMDNSIFTFDQLDGFWVGAYVNVQPYIAGGSLWIDQAHYLTTGYFLDGAIPDFSCDFEAAIVPPFDDVMNGGYGSEGLIQHYPAIGVDPADGTNHVLKAFGGGGAQKLGLGSGGGVVTLTAFDPTHGTKDTVVKLTGTGFLAGATVKFNGFSAKSVKVTSSTEIYAVCPDEVAPLFTQEGPPFYDAAFAHNKNFAKPLPYNSGLSPNDENFFQTWVINQSIPFDVNASIVDYDMRGYWYAQPGHGYNTPTYTPGDHFPDTWKTPYDTSFSDESEYALAGCPFHWTGNVLYDTRDGSIVFAAPADIPTVTIAVTVAGITASKAGWVVDGSADALAPTINSFTPTEGDTGTTVVLSGTNLDTLTKVQFKFVNASSFKSLSATKASAVAPPSVEEGPILVQNPHGYYLSDSPFV